MLELTFLTAAATAVETPTAATSVAGWELKDYIGLISAITAIVALVVSYFVSSRTLRASLANTEASIWQKANETEVKAIRPFMQMSEVNRLLSRDLRDRQADSATFLLLEKLFDREWLKNIPLGEKALVGEIAANAETLREFISKDAKMVDLKIQPYLSRVSAHYRILELAYEGNLGEDGKPFVERYVFPRQIDEVLALEVSRLWNSIPFDRASAPSSR
jgi:hypothetical protein